MYSMFTESSTHINFRETMGQQHTIYNVHTAEYISRYIPGDSYLCDALYSLHIYIEPYRAHLKNSYITRWNVMYTHIFTVKVLYFAYVHIELGKFSKFPYNIYTIFNLTIQHKIFIYTSLLYISTSPWHTIYVSIPFLGI